MSEAKSGLRDLSRSVDELDLGPLVDHLRERLRIPVGEADAAVGFGLADALRLRGAVDAVAVAKIDAGVADGIVGTGRDGEGLLRLHPLELELRAVVVGGILRHRANLPRAVGRGMLLAADRSWIKADQLAAPVQGA